MRFPYRVVADYHVDRLQVYRQKCQSRAILIARRLHTIQFSFSSLTVFLSTIYRLINAVERKLIKVVIATGIHLFPFRTEKLSPFTPMILLYQVGKWVAANFKKPHQLRLMRLFSLAAIAAHFLRRLRGECNSTIEDYRHLWSSRSSGREV